MNFGGTVQTPPSRLHDKDVLEMNDEWYWLPTAVQLSKREDRNGLREWGPEQRRAGDAEATLPWAPSRHVVGKRNSGPLGTSRICTIHG